jgi:hypothetical protein
MIADAASTVSSQAAQINLYTKIWYCFNWNQILSINLQSLHLKIGDQDLICEDCD